MKPQSQEVEDEETLCCTPCVHNSDIPTEAGPASPAGKKTVVFFFFLSDSDWLLRPRHSHSSAAYAALLVNGTYA